MTRAPYWVLPPGALLAELEVGSSGLGEDTARARLARFGPNQLEHSDRMSAFRLLVRQFESPLVLILVFGAGVSLLLREWFDAGIILTIVLASALLSFFQEYRASQSVLALRARLALTTRVVRGGIERTVPAVELVPGDIVRLSAGNLVPADARILSSQDLMVTEAALTGESLPVEKRPCQAPMDAIVAERTNCVFMGSSVRSGTAEILIVETGTRTAFGAIAHRLSNAAPETSFARGVRQFGAMLVRIMFVMVICVLVVNQLLGRPAGESLLFAVALAVGLSPELLPAIISVTLAAGARHLAKGGVLVRRLEAIETLGNMDVLCTDKTGTLTLGTVSLAAALGPDGKPSDPVRDSGFCNAWFETGIANPLDAALVEASRTAGWSADALTKSGELPYDFERRRLSVQVRMPDGASRLVTKGAFADMVAICDTVATPAGAMPLDADWRARLDTLFAAQGAKGLRVLAVAERTLPSSAPLSRDCERGMTFLGLLAFADPPRSDATALIASLRALGITTKIISGDNRHVTAHLAETVGLGGTLLTGGEIAAMSDLALTHRAATTQLFAEIDPGQKERIVRALQRDGRTVGFLGDGINDAPALQVADVGISVDGAVDVARESADILLLAADLSILRQGVSDGRRTFANTLKYIAITVSANFGNMISMALATPLLPFLPLLPKQILLNNFLSDLPSVMISSDRVDVEALELPQRWDIKEIRRFMILFGLVSSAVDVLTFAALLIVFHAGPALFHTVWFLASLATELAALLILRTQRPAFASRPSRLLLGATVAVAVAAVALPYAPRLARLFGLVPLEPTLLAFVAGLVIAYGVATELAKRCFYRATQHS